MGKRYKKSTVIEALCEFQFVPSKSWDLTIPGLIYEKVKKKFPDRQQKIGIGFKFRPTEKGFEHKVEPAPPRIQFHRKNKTALIQIAPDLLVINQLKPYPTWSKFKQMILEALQIYKKVVKPKGFKRIVLKYINKINIKAKSVELSEYFDFYPYISKDLPQLHTGFMSRVEIPYEKNRDRMIVTIGSTPSESPNMLSTILDINYIMANPEAIPIEEFKKWIDHAHLVIEKTYKSCIKNKSRVLFEEVK